MKKRTVIWLLVVVAILVGLYALLVNWSAIKERFFPEELTPYQGDGTTDLMPIETNDSITRVDWTMNGKEFSIYRNEINEFVCEDETIYFDQQLVSSELLNYLTALRATHVLTDVDLAEFGLTEPWMQFTIYDCGPDPYTPLPGDGNVNTFYVGLRNSVTDTYYVTQDFETVYLLQNKAPDHFGNYEDFRVKEFVPEDAAATYISITHDGVTDEYFYTGDDGSGFYSTVFSWYTILEDGSKQPVKIEMLDPVYELFYDVKWNGNIEAHPEDLSIYGLDEPDYRVVFRYSYAETGKDEAGLPTTEIKEGEYILLVGSAASEENTYAMKEGSDVVRTLANVNLKTLRELKRDDILMHNAVVPEWLSIKQFDVTLSDGTSCTCEVRKAEDGTATYFIEGVEVEREDVRDVYISFYNPSIDGIDMEANRSIEDAEITVHFSRYRNTYSEMTLYLIPYNSSLYVVDFADQQQYLVSERVINGIVDAVHEALAKVQ